MIMGFKVNFENINNREGVMGSGWYVAIIW